MNMHTGVTASVRLHQLAVYTPHDRCSSVTPQNSQHTVTVHTRAVTLHTAMHASRWLMSTTETHAPGAKAPYHITTHAHCRLTHARWTGNFFLSPQCPCTSTHSFHISPTNATPRGQHQPLPASSNHAITHRRPTARSHRSAFSTQLEAAPRTRALRWLRISFRSRACRSLASPS
jgi:hypothetical protein